MSLFFLLHLDFFIHSSSDVTMVDHVFTFKTDSESTFSSQKFLIADMTNFSSVETEEERHREQ